MRRRGNNLDRRDHLAYVGSMKQVWHLAHRVQARVKEAQRRARFSRKIQHLQGPRSLDAAPGEVLAIVLVRNGSYYMDVFFDHYEKMGVRHFAFVDNGSSDDTLARLRDRPGVIVDQCDLPLAEYEDLLRQYPAQTYGTHRWCLYVDMDELFDFPGRDVLGIAGLIRILEAQGATALMAQMLEMFPKETLQDVAHLSFAEAVERFQYFDINHVRKLDYYDAETPFADLLKDNTVPDPALQIYFGGVRGKVFGENCCLTKHPLIFNGTDVTPAPHPHLSMGVRCADFTALLKHYKFAGNTVRRDVETLARGDLDHGEDAARVAVLSNTPQLSLFSLDARPWNRIELLVRAGFLVGSERFSAHLERARQ
ncbi:MAG: glycosyltransferase family 2 protein [Pseudomonadota bacterium]